MATAFPNNSYLECSICFEFFKTPKMLSCGHSFCLNCLVRYIDDRKGSFPCAVCKQDVVIPRDGVDKFPTNFTLQTLTDSVRTNDNSTSQPSTRPVHEHQCPNHSEKEVEYYCQTCRLGLCSRCIYIYHPHHKKLQISKSKQFIKHKIENLNKTHTALLETSEKLKYFCDKACNQISKNTEKIICELKEKCKKRQKEIRDNLDKNELQLTKTRQQVMSQIKTITNLLDVSRPTTTEEPSLTLIYSLNKLQDLQKLCENMKTDIPPVTFVKWREGNVKVCDILGSTKTITLYPYIEGTVFPFNYKDIKWDDQVYVSKDRYSSHGMVWHCRARRNRFYRYLFIDIGLLPTESDDYCEIKYTVTLYNKDKDKNVISETRAELWSPNGWRGVIDLPWDTLTDPSEGFIDNQGQFLVRFDIHGIDIKYEYNEWSTTYCRIL